MIGVTLDTGPMPTGMALKKDLDIRRKAQVAGLKRAARGFEKELEAVSAGAGLGRLAKAWDSRIYPERGGSLSAAAIIYPKGGERTQKAFEAFTQGARVRSKNGFWLAIPTDAAPKRGTDGQRINPSNFPEARFGKLRFVYRRGKNPLLVVDNVRISAKTGRVGRQAKNPLLKSGRIRSGLTTVVMFVLVPAVRIGKRFSIAPIETRWRVKIPGFIQQEYRQLAQQAGLEV